MRVPWRLGFVIALLVFLFFGDVPEKTRFWRAFFDAGHTALFGVMALLVRGMFAGRPAERSALRSSLAALAITIAIGAATEVLQTLQAHGDPSVPDLLRDTAGAAAFLLLAWVFRRRQPVEGVQPPPSRAGLARAVAGLAAGGLLLAAGWTLMLTSARYVARDHAYPTLFALDGSWWESEFIELNGNRLTPDAGPAGPGPRAPRLARLDLQPRLYSGIGFHEPYPDWRGRKMLVMTIVSDLNAPLPMAIRVHDAAHDRRYRDRFNRRLIIVPGVNEMRIPIDDIRAAPDRRPMDLRRIRAVLLFAHNLRKPAHLFLGPVRLE